MWDDAKALNALSALLAAVALSALLAAGIGWLARQPVFAIRDVVVTTPLVRASSRELESAIREELAGTFFTMNLDRARSALGRVPWVRSVAVRRQWPQRLEIAVEEHAPLARWSDGGLVDTHGELFAASYAGELPLFGGPEGYAAEIAARYAEWTALLAPLSLSVAELAVSPRGAWLVKARDERGVLTIDLGRDDPNGRLVRFVQGYGRTVGALARAGTRVEHVDLRYRNGFAVRVPGFREKPPKKIS